MAVQSSCHQAWQEWTFLGAGMCIKRKCLCCKQAATCMKARPSVDVRHSILTPSAWHSRDNSSTSCSWQVPAEMKYVAYTLVCKTVIWSRDADVSTAGRVAPSKTQ